MRNLDGVKKVLVKRPRHRAKKFTGKTSFLKSKQLATIVATFLITFMLSVAFSQTLAGDNFGGQVLGASTSLNSTEPVPDLPVASAPQEYASFDNIVRTEPEFVFLPQENTLAPDPLIHRKEFLKQYLSGKHSPLADHVDAISEQSQWKLIVAIAQAESSSCKKYPQYSANCWGIGGASNLMRFSNLDAAIAHVNSLLEKKYISVGLDSPSKLVNKWVGHKNNQWEAAVQQELDNLQGVQ